MKKYTERQDRLREMSKTVGETYDLMGQVQGIDPDIEQQKKLIAQDILWKLFMQDETSIIIPEL